mgnify:CR=1 FL=1
MTVEENLSFPLTIQKMPKADQKAKIDDVLEIVGLTDKKKAYPGNLSGGQRSSVDFPHPDGPIKAVISFSGISRLIFFNAWKSS